MTACPHLVEVGRVLVPLGVSGHGHTEVVAVLLTDETHQVHGMRQAALTQPHKQPQSV